MDLEITSKPPFPTLVGMDIYLIDLIMKGYYTKGQRILDAGVGSGRNLNWFIHQDFDLSACDYDPASEEMFRQHWPHFKGKWTQCDLAKMPYDDAYFDHIICNAVLHFAQNRSHFFAMMSEMARVLKPNGTLFIRTCSDIGLAEKGKFLGNGRYLLQDESERFLLTERLIGQVMEEYGLRSLEFVKSLNVHNIRVMTTLVFEKE